MQMSWSETNDRSPVIMLIRCPLVKKKTVSPLIIIDMLIFHWTALNDVNHLPDSFLLVKELCKSSNTEMELIR